MADIPVSIGYPPLKSRVIIGGAVIFGYLILYALWLLSGGVSQTEELVVGTLALLFPALVGMALALRSQRASFLAEQRRIWLFIFAGLTIWVVGGLVNGLSGSVASRPAIIILAAGLHLLGYLAILAGLIAYPRQLRQSFGRFRLLLEISLSSAAVITLCWLGLIRPILTNILTSRAELSWIAAYELVDLLLLVILINMYALTRPGGLNASLSWVTLGLTLLICFDFAAIDLFFQAGYQVGSLLDLGWAVGLCGIILGVLFQPDSSEPTPPAGEVQFLPDKGIQSQAHLIEQRVQTGMPLLAVVALGGYVIWEWQISGVSDPLGLWMTVILAVGLVARQGVLAGERELQQYAVLVNSIAEPAFICDRRGRLKMVNPALLTALGYGQASSLLDQPMLSLFVEEFLLEGIVKAGLTGGWSGEAYFRRQDKTTFPVYLSLRPIQAMNIEGLVRSDKLALAGTAHDLTEQKAQQGALKTAYDQVAAAHHALATLNDLLEEKVDEKTRSLSLALEQLEQQNLTLQKLDELKTDFVSLVSHELRAPLTNISGGIELVLARSNRLPESTRQSLTLVQVEIRRLAHFVETILDLSALDAGRLPFYLTPLELSEIVSGLEKQLASTPGADRLHWDVQKDLPFILADSRALTSVFFHLIDNAIKYAPQGDILIRINPSTDSEVINFADPENYAPHWSVAGINKVNPPGPVAEADALSSGETASTGAAPFYPPDETRRVIQVQVIDQGSGISTEALPLLFNKFFRAHPGDSQTVYGHGLGLYMVKRLLQAMGGDIRVENNPEGGACFTFWLWAIEEKDDHETAVGG